LEYRYVGGQLHDGLNGQIAERLWPWPMEQRILGELGLSVTKVVGQIIPQQVNPAPPVRRQRRLEIGALRTNASGPVATYTKLEASFSILNSTAGSTFWPYDAQPPNGIPAGTGISVNALFVDPAGREYTQPAFFYEEFLEDVRDGREWHYPAGEGYWKVRFSPTQAGEWKFKLTAVVVRRVSLQSSWLSLREQGFVRQQADPRYFEFDNHTLFPASESPWDRRWPT
jgi:hypothetical protein